MGAHCPRAHSGTVRILSWPACCDYSERSPSLLRPCAHNARAIRPRQRRSERCRAAVGRERRLEAVRLSEAGRKLLRSYSFTALKSVVLAACGRPTMPTFMPVFPRALVPRSAQHAGARGQPGCSILTVRRAEAKMGGWRGQRAAVSGTGDQSQRTARHRGCDRTRAPSGSPVKPGRGWLMTWLRGQCWGGAKRIVTSGTARAKQCARKGTDLAWCWRSGYGKVAAQNCGEEAAHDGWTTGGLSGGGSAVGVGGVVFTS